MHAESRFRKPFLAAVLFVFGFLIAVSRTFAVCPPPEEALRVFLERGQTEGSHYRMMAMDFASSPVKAVAVEVVPGLCQGFYALGSRLTVRAFPLLYTEDLSVVVPGRALVDSPEVEERLARAENSLVGLPREVFEELFAQANFAVRSSSSGGHRVLCMLRSDDGRSAQLLRGVKRAFESGRVSAVALYLDPTPGAAGEVALAAMAVNASPRLFLKLLTYYVHPENIPRKLAATVARVVERFCGNSPSCVLDRLEKAYEPARRAGLVFPVCFDETGKILNFSEGGRSHEKQK